MATNSWERREFTDRWWRIYRGDRRWTPPVYPTLVRELNPARSLHLARLNPAFLHVEAFYRRQSNQRAALADPASGIFETPLAAAVILRDERRRDGTAYLGLYHGSSDDEATSLLLYSAMEVLMADGYYRIIGPTGLSPWATTGVLQDHWNQAPPLHTPYNPPYLPEMLEHRMCPQVYSHLYHLPVPSYPQSMPHRPADLIPLDPARLAADLLPLLGAATENRAGFALPDAAEAAFLLRWWGHGLIGWLAQIADQPVGFILLQPDLAARLRQAGGGRRLHWRAWLRLRRGAPVGRGRVLLMGVLPKCRGQGVGRQLWNRALQTAREAEWQQLTVGPVAAGETAAAILRQKGAEPRQSYALYEWTF